MQFAKTTTAAFGRGLQILLGVAVVLAVCFVGAYFLLFRGPVDAAAGGMDLARLVAKDLSRAFQLEPKIVSENRIFLESSGDITQLVTTEVTYHVRHRMEHSWGGSTKRLEVMATARALAGFDLEKPLRVEIDPGGKMATIEYPEPELLAVEIRDTEFTRDESGWLNRLRPEDRNEALRELEETARQRVDSVDLLRRAEAGFQDRMRFALGALGIESVEFTRPIPPSDPPP